MKIFHFVTLTLSACLIYSQAAQSHDMLIKVQDSVTIYTDRGTKELDRLELWPFPQSIHYTTNTTVTGRFCYAESMTQFEDVCEKAHPPLQSGVLDQWIILTMFDKVATNNLMNEIKSKRTIIGIIIGATTQIESSIVYQSPLISLVPSIQFERLMQYSIPFSLATETQSGLDITIVQSHLYDESCGHLDLLTYYSYILTCVYFLVLGTWVTLTWYIYGVWSDHNRAFGTSGNLLQRALTVIPALKLVKTFIFAQYASACPWNDQLSARYMMMALVTTSTIYQTTLITMFLLISKGWPLIRQSLNREEALHLMLMMGALWNGKHQDTHWSIYQYALRSTILHYLQEQHNSK
ncbi:hypothetical protein FGO68_gene12974 [Halteria grandinella]|uniref:Uncharacterized protein n=1 Tax=Halteria grandinella TaxID=5974 RepID=A0A8J8T4G0_HALGN|nr:hypothetical protein FGO68_gene12974 [Halteria grandinella]